MSSCLEMAEIATLARKLAEYARTENDAALARALDAIAEAADRASSDISVLPGANRELHEAYVALYAPKEGGLSNFFRWHPDLSTRQKLNAELEMTRTRLDKLLLGAN